MIPKQIPRQRDFSAGEIVDHAKRRDDSPMVRSGGRQMSNKRILASGAMDQRPGRVALFLENGRTDEIRIYPTIHYKFSFGEGSLHIRDANNVVVLSQGGFPWTLATVQRIVWAVIGTDVVICFQGMRPRIARWNGSTWSTLDFEFRITNGGQKRAPFLRLSRGGVTMTPSGQTGSITIDFSSPVLVAGHVGTRMRYQGRQLTITAVSSATSATATVNERLLGGQRLTFSSAVDGSFTVGDIVSGSISGARGEISAFPTSTTMDVVLLSMQGFHYSGGISQSTDTVIGPTAQGVLSAVPVEIAPPASPNWDEEAMNTLRGWPSSVFADQERLGFCDFPNIPGGIAWSAIGVPNDMHVGAVADDGLFEIVPRSARVYHVVGGDDEFVFTNIGVFYIPITEANPLRPGSVAFREVTSDAAAAVKPISTPDGVVFVTEGLKRVVAIRPTGQTAKPYLTRDVSEFHSHLIKSPVALAASTGDGQFAERYVYVLNADGTLAVGRYDFGKEWVGWVPWTAADGAAFEWVSALGPSVLFHTRYTHGGTTRRLVETPDVNAWLDSQVSVGNLPPALAPGPGLGPLWFMAGGTVALMDGLKYLGTRSIDTLGNIIATGGETFPAGVVAGLSWREVFEPFVPHVEGGQSAKQTMRRRKIAKGAVTVQRSIGFMIAGRRVPPYRKGENEDGAPVMREETFRFKKLGRRFDPRIELVKDMPGPLRVLEMAMEVTI